MFKELQELIKNHKSLYFNFPVACIIKTKDNKIYKGVNVETSSPSAGICAERNALFSMITDNASLDLIESIYILNTTEKFITPCFICRQALSDFVKKDVLLISYNVNGEEKSYKISDLCPHPFGGDSL